MAKGDFQSIDVGVDPSTVGVGLHGKVHIDAVTSDGKHYNLLESSQLKTEVSPSYVATLQRETLQGQRVGNGKLAVTFGSGLSGQRPILPWPCRGPSLAAVHPESLDLAVGEIADIAYISPDRSPVHLSCSKAGIVEITADNRLIGRAVGDTQVTVNQSGKTLGTVAVTVAKADFQGIFFDPGSLAVEVDDTMHPKVFAMVAGSDPPRNAEIAPDVDRDREEARPRVRRLRRQGLRALRREADQHQFAPGTCRADGQLEGHGPGGGRHGAVPLGTDAGRPDRFAAGPDDAAARVCQL